MLDTALNSLMLGLAVRLGGRKIRPARLAMGALLGAAVALAARRTPLTRMQGAMLWFPCAAGMMALALGREALRRPVRSAGLLLGAAGLLGGTVLALGSATGSLYTAYALGGAYTLYAAARVRRMRKTGRYAAKIICRCRGRTAALDALIDSGNTLVDYLTQLPVIVIPEETGRRCFHLENTVLRPIFADTAGGRQMMGVMVPQEVILRTDADVRRVRAVIALSGAMHGHMPALVPAALSVDTEQEE